MEGRDCHGSNEKGNVCIQKLRSERQEIATGPTRKEKNLQRERREMKEITGKLQGVLVCDSAYFETMTITATSSCMRKCKGSTNGISYQFTTLEF